jgi:hypothetical protein
MVPVGLLILNFKIYPRWQYDGNNGVHRTVVRKYKKAMAAGDTFPAVIVDRKTNMVVDGFHRVTAKKEQFGPEAKIKVEYHDYKDQIAMLEESKEINERHGEPLNSSDIQRCMTVARDLGISDKRFSAMFGISQQDFEDQISQSYMQRATLVGDEGATETEKLVSPKVPYKHLAGKAMSEAQLEVNKKAIGMPLSYYANLLRDSINLKMLNYNNKGEMRAMDQLFVALKRWLKK